MTRRTRTCATCRIEHTCTLSLVSSFDSFITPRGSRPFALVIPSAFHPCVVVFEFLFFTFYFFLLFSFLILPFFLMSDGDSMTTNNLRDSANGTFVTLDDSSHFTVQAHGPPKVRVSFLWGHFEKPQRACRERRNERHMRREREKSAKFWAPHPPGLHPPRPPLPPGTRPLGATFSGFGSYLPHLFMLLFFCTFCCVYFFFIFLFFELFTVSLIFVFLVI